MHGMVIGDTMSRWTWTWTSRSSMSLVSHKMVCICGFAATHIKHFESKKSCRFKTLDLEYLSKRGARLTEMLEQGQYQPMCLERHVITVFHSIKLMGNSRRRTVASRGQCRAEAVALWLLACLLPAAQADGLMAFLCRHLPGGMSQISTAKAGEQDRCCRGCRMSMSPVYSASTDKAYSEGLYPNCRILT